MEKRVCFAYLKKEKTGLFVFGTNMECSILRSVLRCNGIASMSYLDKDLPSLEDIAEGILSVADRHIVLWVDYDNFLAVKALEYEILKLDDSLKILKLAEYGFEADQELQDFSIISENHEYNIIRFAKEKDEDFIIDKDLSPYRDGTALLSEAGDLGVLLCSKFSDGEFRTLNGIMGDMDSINEYHKDNTGLSIELMGVNLNRHPYYKEILEKLSGMTNKFVISVDYEHLQEFKQLSKNIRLKIQISSLLEDANTIDNLLDVKSIIEGISFDISILHNEKNFKELIVEITGKITPNISFFGASGYWSEININKLPTENLNLIKPLECTTFHRGYFLSRGGEYVGVPLNGFTKHVQIKYDYINSKILKKLNEFCSVNSSLYIEDYVPANSNKYHMDQLNKIMVFDEIRDSYRKLMYENCALPINIMALSNDGDMYLNDYYYKPDYKVIRASYSYVRSEIKNLTSDKFFLVNICDENDYKCFIKDIEIFIKTNSIAHSPLLHGRLENACRYLSRNFCFVEKMPRFSIGKDGEIYPCFEETEPIGNIEDSYFDVMQEAYVQHENELRSRNCIKCNANAWCPKCTKLPDYLKNDYCDLMLNRSYVTDYILESRMVIKLINTFDNYKDKSPNDFLLANEFMQIYLKDEKNGIESPYFAKYVCLSKCGDDHAIWSPSSGKFFKISKVIAVVAECLLKHWNPTEIPGFIEKYFEIDAQSAQEVCDVSFKKFMDYGLLHRPIK